MFQYNSRGPVEGEFLLGFKVDADPNLDIPRKTLSSPLTETQRRSSYVCALQWCISVCVGGYYHCFNSVLFELSNSRGQPVVV